MKNPERLARGACGVEAAREIDDVGRICHTFDQPAELASSEFNFPGIRSSTVPLRREALKSREEVLEEFDANVVKFKKLLAECDEKTLGEEWILRNGEHIILQQPRANALRTFGISHMVHHRAQLGVYLRLLDIPVLGFYGTSADEEGK